MATADVVPFVYSLAIGLLLGLERERSHDEGEDASAGLRTFALLAVLGTVAALLGPWVVAAGVVGVAVLLAVGYRRTSADDPGTTTEFAAMAAYLLGALAYTRAPLAAALAIVGAVLLASKPRIHRFARNVISAEELDDGLKFLIIAFVVLPLLPDRNLGPYGAVNPRHVWLIVVAVTGISWIGYIAVRILGADRGLLATGLAGGFISASAATASLGRAGRSLPQADRGVVLAAAEIGTVATFLELAAVLAVVSRTVVGHAWPSLAVGTVVLSGVVALGYRRAAGRTTVRGEPVTLGRPFRLLPAVVLAGMLTLALLVGRWWSAVLGPKGVVLAAGGTGLADAHAGAIASASLFRQGQVGLAAALLAVAASLAANTVTKCVLAFAAGGREFGLRYTAVVAPVVALVVGGLALTAALL